MDEPKILTEQDCLIALMVSITIADGNVRTAELVKIQSAVNNLPIFGTYDIGRLNLVSQIVFDLFETKMGWTPCSDWCVISCPNACERPMRSVVMLRRLTA